MQENGSGTVHTIDNVSALQRDPSITDLLEQTGLGDHVSPVFTARSYNWELMKILDHQTKDGVTTPLYDMVFIDGGHTWDSDGFAFLLADRLLKPGGWLLLDDVMWTPSESAGEDWVEAMPAEERDIAHVEKIFKLLVMTHPAYGDFEFDGHWAWARKRPDVGESTDRSSLVKDIYNRTDTARKSYRLRRYLRRLLRL
jgi:hypothetical protein